MISFDYSYIARTDDGRICTDLYEISEKDILHLLNISEIEANECRRVTESSLRGESCYKGDGRPGDEKIQNHRLASYKEVLYRDTKTDRFAINHMHGRVIKQAERNHYFRGENNIYPSSLPSFFRNRPEGPEERFIYDLTEDLRIADFDILIHRLTRVKAWEESGFTVLTEVLAQHYGLKTRWLDITNDFPTALFFASCYFKNGKWHYFKQDEIKINNRYSVIYQMPWWRAEEDLTISTLEPSIKTYPILPIGYQPFLRCSNQYGYGIRMDEPVALTSIGFEKLCFKKSEKISRWIYEYMDGGRKIYPADSLTPFESTLKELASATSFSEKALCSVLASRNQMDEYAQIKEKLLDHGISIKTNTQSQHTENLIKLQNKRDRNFSIPSYQTRLTYKPPQDPEDTGAGE